MTRLLILLLLAASAFAQDWSALDRQAEDLYVKGDLKEAIRVAKLAAAAASDPHQSGRSLDREGFFEYTSGDLQAGEQHLREALALRQSKLGTDTLDYAESANDLALFCRDSNKLDEGRTLAEQSVDIRRRLLGPNDLAVAESLNTLGSTVAYLGDYEQAIARFEQAAAIHEHASKSEDLGEEYGTLRINLAGTYQRVGQYGPAEASFEKGLAVLRRKPGTQHPAYSASLVAYAYLQADLGHYAAAERLYNEAGGLLREQLGEQHPVYTAFLNNRAVLYTSLGNLQEAEQDYRKALELKRKIFGPDALTVGASLRNLARLVAGRNREEGRRLFQEAVDLYAKNPKPPPYDYASALMGLGEIQRDAGELAAARATFERASNVVAQGVGTRHPLYAAVRCDLGMVDAAAHQYPQAAALMQEAIDIITQSQGADHPDLARYLARLAEVDEATGDFRGAATLYRRALDVSDRAMGEMLTIGSESSKRAAVANTENPVPALIELQRRAGARFPEARVLAFEAVARRKGRVLDEVHDWDQGLRGNADAGVRARFQQREELLGCEASLVLALGYRDLKPAVVGSCALAGTDLAGRYERLLQDLRTKWTDALGKQALTAVAALRQRIDGLEAVLSRDLPQFASVIRPARLADVREHMAPGEVLVEFAEYAAPEKRYGAFLAGKAGELEWIELGPAAPIDRAARDLIAAANDWIEPTAADALKSLSEKLRPVISALAAHHEVTRVRVSPDGAIGLLPFGALTDAGGRHLIERYPISYLPAGRDLAAATPAAANGAAVIAVSPGGGSFARLGDAAAEAREVKRWIPGAQVLQEGQATEQRIKEIHHPSLLHIVGHGTVRGTEDCRVEPDSAGCKLGSMDPAARVMNLSAIVLEEAYGRGGASKQDGFLTALELQTLDLQGTEMLVLSQCRMADGVASTGEGIYGMRRAAVIAGVRTFVAPLWKVTDAAELQLMTRFYRELRAGKSRAEALRTAQLELMATKPFLEWAPYILSGDPTPLPAAMFR